MNDSASQKDLAGLSPEITEVGSYRILELIDESADRTLYRATDLQGERQLLISLLTAMRLPSNIPAADSVKIMRMRAHDIAAFSHPNCLSIVDAGEQNGDPFIVHEFTTGRTLKTVLQERTRLGFQELLKVLSDIASALDAAHARGIFHGALRSNSVFVGRAGKAQLGGLGIEYLFQGLMVSHAAAQSAEQVVYQPLERLQGAQPNRKSDLYSFGVVAFEALTGHLPFTANSIEGMQKLIMSGAQAQTAQFVANLSPEVDIAIERALSPQSAKRFETAQEFVLALASGLGIEPLTLHVEAAKESADNADANGAQEKFSRHNRPYANVNPDMGFGATNYDFTIPPRRTKKPGAMFEHVSRQPVLDEAAQQRLRNRRLIRIAIGLWGLTVLVGLAVLTYVASARQDSASPEAAVVAHSFEAPVFAVDGMEELELPRVETPPANTPIRSLTDRELLGLLWNGSSSETITIEALHEAQRRRIPDLVSALIRPLHDADATVRAEAARVAGTLADRRISPYLLPLTTDPDSAVRVQTAQALGTLGEHKTLTFLANRFQVEEDRDVRQALRGAIDTITGYSVSDSELVAFIK